MFSEIKRLFTTDKKKLLSKTMPPFFLSIICLFICSFIGKIIINEIFIILSNVFKVSSVLLLCAVVYIYISLNKEERRKKEIEAKQKFPKYNID